jgi:hypothetical protein
MKQSGKDVQAAIKRVRDELARIEAGDPAVRQHLAQLMAEIEGHFGRAAGAPPVQTLSGSLKEAIRRFEVKHPALSAYLAEIAAALG